MMQDPRGFKLPDLIRALWVHKWKAGATVVGFVAVGVLTAFVVTPVYRAEILLAPVTTAAPGPLSIMPTEFAELMRNAGFDSYDQERTEAVAILRSREFTSEFIREEGLLPILYEDQWDRKAKSWRARAGQDTPTVWLAYEKFDCSVRGIEDSYTSGLVTLSIEWKDPVLAAAWANKMIALVNRHLQSRAITEGKRSLDFLTRELQRTNVGEVRATIYRLVETQMQRMMVANIKEEYGFRVLDKAVPPEKHIRPNRKLMAVVAFVIGVLVASCLSMRWEVRAGSLSSGRGCRAER
ncbi:MAG: hypothetical protein KAJ04_05375 [Candidatus Eisenbacteria sp.]|nr:hypothetical protein [Candidatus Eisenbacteria bacterium]